MKARLPRLASSVILSIGATLAFLASSTASSAGADGWREQAEQRVASQEAVLDGYRATLASGTSPEATAEIRHRLIEASYERMGMVECRFYPLHTPCVGELDPRQMRELQLEQIVEAARILAENPSYPRNESVLYGLCLALFELEGGSDMNTTVQGRKLVEQAAGMYIEYYGKGEFTDEIWYLLGRVAADTGDPSEAAARFAKATNNSDWGGFVEVELSWALHQAGRTDEAIARLTQQLQLPADSNNVRDTNEDAVTDILLDQLATILFNSDKEPNASDKVSSLGLPAQLEERLLQRLDHEARDKGL